MKLLPCPFCGIEPRVSPITPWGEKKAKSYSISCSGSCLMKSVTTGAYEGSEDRAAYAWNTRDLRGEGKMSLQDHVPSLELCKRWKEVGGRQDTELFWILSWNRWFINHKEDIKVELHELGKPEFPQRQIFAAPLVGELMEWMKKNSLAVFASRDETIWGIEAYDPLFPWIDSKTWIDSKNLMDGLMQMAIDLKEEK